MTKTNTLNGTEIDRPHYVVVRDKDTLWFGGAVVVGVLAALSPLLFGGYGFNWQTIAAVLAFAIAVWIAWGAFDGINYCTQMINNRRRETNRRVRRSTRATQTA